MSSNPKLSPRRERFAQLLAAGEGQSAAYRQCFNADGMKPQTVWSEASRLAATPQVSARLGVLQAAQAVEIVHDMAAIRSSVLARLSALADGAESESARVRALELLGKASGLFEERPQNPAEQGSTIELRKRLETRLNLMLAAPSGS